MVNLVLKHGADGACLMKSLKALQECVDTLQQNAFDMMLIKLARQVREVMVMM